MSPSPGPSRSLSIENGHRIPKWARVYAQNRSLGVVVNLLVFMVIFALIAGSSFVAGEAYRSGNLPLLGLSIVLLAPTLAAVVYLSVPRWGGRLNERVVQRLYGQEGSVTLSPSSERIKMKIWARILAGCFGACVIASVILLGFLVEIPSKYMQPISALCVVPLLVGMWLLMRPIVGCAPLLWPVLYAIHAIGILAGAPIVFTGPWDFLNILIPIGGYGILAGMVGHFYSRFALLRLKALTKADSSKHV